MTGKPLLNADAATVEDIKVRDYLLEPSHPDNDGKAAFFQLFGFTRHYWIELQEALKGTPADKSSGPH